jgi:acetylornithine deacetylase
MQAKDVLARLDTRYCLDFLSRMVQHKSYSQTEGERVLAGWMAEQMRGLGLDAELTLVEGERVNAIGRLRGSGGGKSLLFNGHIDTNPVTEGWTVDPWGGKVDDKFIYGIGVSNMKSGDAAYFCALKTLIDAGVKLRGDVILTFVVGELQGGVGTVALVKQGWRADYFINSEPTDLQALTMHAAAFVFTIELVGDTRHLSKREEAVDALVAACDLVPRLNALKFSGAQSPEHEKINRVHVGVMHGALGRELHEWRPPQVADFVKLKGSGRYAPGQTEAGALADLRGELAALERRHPSLKATVELESATGRVTMPSFEVARDNPIVQAINAAYEEVRGQKATDRRHYPAGLLRHRRRPSLSPGRDGGRRVRAGRALQHHAGRARRRGRLPGYD